MWDYPYIAFVSLIFFGVSDVFSIDACHVFSVSTCKRIRSTGISKTFLRLIQSIVEVRSQVTAPQILTYGIPSTHLEYIPFT